MLIDTSAFVSTKTNCDFFLNETDLRSKYILRL